MFQPRRAALSCLDCFNFASYPYTDLNLTLVVDRPPDLGPAIDHGAVAMAQSFPYYTHSTPPASVRQPSSSSSVNVNIPPPLSKRDSLTNHPRVPSAPPGSSSLHQQLFQQRSTADGILDRPLNRTKGAEVGMGAWAFLFAEIVSYSQSRSDSVDDLEKRYVLAS